MVPSTTSGDASNEYVEAPECMPIEPHWKTHAGVRPLTFEVLIDEHPYPVSAAYGLNNVPAIFVVQPDGTISLSEFGFTKHSLNEIAGFSFFTPDDGLPSSRPG